MVASSLPYGHTEMRLLGAACVIGLLQIGWASTAGQRQRGFAWGAGARDEPRAVHGVPARLERASANFLETFPIFAAGALAALALGRLGPMTATGAWIYVVARVLYVPLYALGVPILRSLVWFVSIIGIFLELVALL